MEYSSDTLSATVMDLLPFTSYDCNVTASTAVGEGPPADVERERTDEDSKCVCTYFNAYGFKTGKCAFTCKNSVLFGEFSPEKIVVDIWVVHVFG